MPEKWLPIKGFETSYLISNKGIVRSLVRERKVDNKGGKALTKERDLKEYKTNHGYIKYSLTAFGKKKKVYAHRLVAEAFLINLEKYPCINHIDGVKTNNDVSNLEWCTFSQNNKHAYNAELRKPYNRNGTRNPRSVLTNEQAIAIKNKIDNKERIANICREFNVSDGCVSAIKNGKTWGWLFSGKNK